MVTEFSEGYFIAERQPNGEPGRPVGNDEGAISLFDDLELAARVVRSMAETAGPLSIFKVNMVVVGEVPS